MFNYDRLLQTAMREFESGIIRLVEREFEALRALPDDVAAIPFIGEMPYTNEQFNPHAPAEELAALKALVAQALRAQKWFEFEAPAWAQPLPLRFEECVQLNRLYGDGVGPDWTRRFGLISRYAQDLRSLRWRYERMLPFEQYCAQVLNP
jgi:hypothetical protein